jgi:hypothetical protein
MTKKNFKFLKNLELRGIIWKKNPFLERHFIDWRRFNKKKQIFYWCRNMKYFFQASKN